ncbi:hypothetical protein BKA63DRAFT_581752 [Paraphoma chrysanthemicola]|nr:hypothetical protein BKA63DRAFT_581752 [Paraphoma chrysanthemicola]
MARNNKVASRATKEPVSTSSKTNSKGGISGGAGRQQEIKEKPDKAVEKRKEESKKKDGNAVAEVMQKAPPVVKGNKKSFFGSTKDKKNAQPLVNQSMDNGKYIPMAPISNPRAQSGIHTSAQTAANGPQDKYQAFSTDPQNMQTIPQSPPVNTRPHSLVQDSQQKKRFPASDSKTFQPAEQNVYAKNEKRSFFGQALGKEKAQVGTRAQVLGNDEQQKDWKLNLMSETLVKRKALPSQLVNQDYQMRASSPWLVETQTIPQLDGWKDYLAHDIVDKKGNCFSQPMVQNYQPQITPSTSPIMDSFKVRRYPQSSGLKYYQYDSSQHSMYKGLSQRAHTSTQSVVQATKTMVNVPPVASNNNMQPATPAPMQITLLNQVEQRHSTMIRGSSKKETRFHIAKDNMQQPRKGHGEIKALSTVPNDKAEGHNNLDMSKAGSANNTLAMVAAMDKSFKLSRSDKTIKERSGSLVDNILGKKEKIPLGERLDALVTGPGADKTPMGQHDKASEEESEFLMSGALPVRNEQTPRGMDRSEKSQPHTQDKHFKEKKIHFGKASGNCSSRSAADEDNEVHLEAKHELGMNSRNSFVIKGSGKNDGPKDDEQRNIAHPSIGHVTSKKDSSEIQASHGEKYHHLAPDDKKAHPGAMDRYDLDTSKILVFKSSGKNENSKRIGKNNLSLPPSGHEISEKNDTSEIKVSHEKTRQLTLNHRDGHAIAQSQETKEKSEISKHTSRRKEKIVGKKPGTGTLLEGVKLQHSVHGEEHREKTCKKKRRKSSEVMSRPDALEEKTETIKFSLKMKKSEKSKVKGADGATECGKDSIPAPGSNEETVNGEPSQAETGALSQNEKTKPASKDAKQDTAEKAVPQKQDKKGEHTDHGSEQPRGKEDDKATKGKGKKLIDSRLGRKERRLLRTLATQKLPFPATQPHSNDLSDQKFGLHPTGNAQGPYVPGEAQSGPPHFQPGEHLQPPPNHDEHMYHGHTQSPPTAAYPESSPQGPNNLDLTTRKYSTSTSIGRATKKYVLLGESMPSPAIKNLRHKLICFSSVYISSSTTAALNMTLHHRSKNTALLLRCKLNNQPHRLSIKVRSHNRTTPLPRPKTIAQNHTPLHHKGTYPAPAPQASDPVTNSESEQEEDAPPPPSAPVRRTPAGPSRLRHALSRFHKPTQRNAAQPQPQRAAPAIESGSTSEDGYSSSEDESPTDPIPNQSTTRQSQQQVQNQLPASQPSLHELRSAGPSAQQQIQTFAPKLIYDMPQPAAAQTTPTPAPQSGSLVVVKVQQHAGAGPAMPVLETESSNEEDISDEDGEDQEDSGSEKGSEGSGDEDDEEPESGDETDEEESDEYEESIEDDEDDDSDETGTDEIESEQDTDEDEEGENAEDEKSKSEGAFKLNPNLSRPRYL